MNIKSLRLTFSAIIAVLAMAAASPPAHAANGIVTMPVPGSYEQAVDKFKKSVTGGGMMILATVDHGRILSMTGLQVKSELFLIGNPNVGKQLFSADHRVALLIPLRVAIFEGTDGRTYLSYEKPSASLGRLQDARVTSMASMLDQKMAQLGGMLMH